MKRLNNVDHLNSELVPKVVKSWAKQELRKQGARR